MDADKLNVVNVAEVAELVDRDGGYWESATKPLTPALEPRLG